MKNILWAATLWAAMRLAGLLSWPFRHHPRVVVLPADPHNPAVLLAQYEDEMAEYTPAYVQRLAELYLIPQENPR